MATRRLTYYAKTENQPNRELAATRAVQQRAYDVKKEDFAEKMRQKEHKKRLEKLNRYKGVGELGNRMAEFKLNNDEQTVGFYTARQMQQDEMDSGVNCEEVKEERLRELQRNRTKEHEKRLAKLAHYKGVGELGHRLNDSSSVKEEKRLRLNMNNGQAVKNNEIVPDCLREMDEEEEIKRLEEFAYLKKVNGSDKNHSSRNISSPQGRPADENMYCMNIKSDSNANESVNFLGAASIPFQKNLRKEVKVHEENTDTLGKILKVCQKRDQVLESHKKIMKPGVNAYESDNFNLSVLRRKIIKNKPHSKSDLNKEQQNLNVSRSMRSTCNKFCDDDKKDERPNRITSSFNIRPTCSAAYENPHGKNKDSDSKKMENDVTVLYSSFSEDEENESNTRSTEPFVTHSESDSPLKEVVNPGEAKKSNLERGEDTSPEKPGSLKKENEEDPGNRMTEGRRLPFERGYHPLLDRIMKNAAQN